MNRQIDASELGEKKKLSLTMNGEWWMNECNLRKKLQQGLISNHHSNILLDQTVTHLDYS